MTTYSKCLIAALIAMVACEPDSKNVGEVISEGSDSGTATDSMTSGETMPPGDGSETGTGTGGPFEAACNQQGFLESAEQWETDKNDNGETYYMIQRVRDTGPFGDPLENGCEYTFTVQVTDGAVTSRTMETGIFGSHDITDCDPAWSEEGEALGSNLGALRPLTMDEAYALCCDTVLTQDPEENWLTFTTAQSGLLDHCSYFSMNCADSCSTAGDDENGQPIEIDEVVFGVAP